MCVCVCASPLSVTKRTSTPPNHIPVPGSRHSSYALFIHVCLYVCSYICARMKMCYESDKYQQI